MSEKNLISIYCPTYNSGVKRTLLSLESARLQEYTNKELIIGDDGSRDDTVQAIETFLSKYENNFKRVVLIKHDENIGTVKNLESIYDHCRGELMIGASPGDPLYSNRTLFDIAEYYESRDIDFFVALTRGYQFNSTFSEVNFLKPHPREESIMMNPKKAFKKLVRRNFISGMSFVRTAKLSKMEEFRLPNEIRLLEDWPFVLLYTLSNRPIHLMKKFIRWYEYGTGISTRPNLASQQLRDDWNSFLIYLKRRLCFEEGFPSMSRNFCRIIKRQIGYNSLGEKVSNTLARRIYRTVNFPEITIGNYLRRMADPFSRWDYVNILRELESKQGQGFKPLLLKYCKQ